MVWDEIDVDRLLPDEKQYSIVKINTMKPPFEEGAAVKEYEVDDLEDAATPDLMETIWMAYDQDGNSQTIG